MFKVWRLYSLFNEDIVYELLYTGTLKDSDIFIKNYIYKLKIVYPYYDRIYVVKNMERLEDSNYVDVMVYKNKLRRSISCIDKCFYNIDRYFC